MELSDMSATCEGTNQRGTRGGGGGDGRRRLRCPVGCGIIRPAGAAAAAVSHHQSRRSHRRRETAPEPEPEPEPALPAGWARRRPAVGPVFYAHQSSGYAQMAPPPPTSPSAADTKEEEEVFREPSQGERDGDGALLVGRRVHVAFWGAGTVVAFRKRVGFGSSAHDILFDKDRRCHTLKLRRKTNTDPEKLAWRIGPREPCDDGSSSSSEPRAGLGIVELTNWNFARADTTHCHE